MLHPYYQLLSDHINLPSPIKSIKFATHQNRPSGSEIIGNTSSGMKNRSKKFPHTSLTTRENGNLTNYSNPTRRGAACCAPTNCMHTDSIHIMHILFNCMHTDSIHIMHILFNCMHTDSVHIMHVLFNSNRYGRTPVPIGYPAQNRNHPKSSCPPNGANSSTVTSRKT